MINVALGRRALTLLALTARQVQSLSAATIDHVASDAQKGPASRGQAFPLAHVDCGAR